MLKGAPSPLWKNPSPVFFKIYFGVAFFASLLFICTFIALNYYTNLAKRDAGKIHFVFYLIQIRLRLLITIRTLNVLQSQLNWLKISLL